MLVKIETFIEVPPRTSLLSIENEVDTWIEQMCLAQGDWMTRNDTRVEEQ